MHALLDFFADVAYNPFMLTVGQVKAARALLGWRQVDLAAKAAIAEVSVKNLERGSSDPRSSTLRKVQYALEKAGIEFIVGGARLKDPS